MSKKKQKFRNPELTAFMRKCRGERTINEIQQRSGDQQYWRHETEGYLPNDPAMVQKIAQALGCPVEELIALGKNQKRVLADILPIIKAVAANSSKGLAREELEFLLEIQQSFPKPMTPQLIQELLTNRRLSETYVIEEIWPSE